MSRRTSHMSRDPESNVWSTSEWCESGQDNGSDASRLHSDLMPVNDAEGSG